MSASSNVGPNVPLVSRSAAYATHIPINFFGCATGIGGLGSAWRLASLHFNVPVWPSTVFATLGIVIFVAIAIAYAAKLIAAPQAVAAEFRHPVTGCLFGLVPISLLVLPLPIAPFTPRFAVTLWALGAAGSISLAWIILYRWLNCRQKTETASPAWIVAVGGPFNIPLALPALGLESFHQLAVFAFSIGMFFSLPVFTLIFSRLIFEAPPPSQAKAALLILTAPFSIGYSSYTIISGQNDLFSQALYLINLFMLSILLGLLVYLPRSCPFRLAWWAVSFPLAASTSAAFRFAATNPNPVNDVIAALLLALTTIIVLWLLMRTVWGIAAGDLRTLTGL